MPTELTIEQQWIEIIKNLTDDDLIGDDCAVLPDGTLLTADMLVEGNHFLRSKISLCDLGWKALAVNISDIAAMGGLPGFATVSLGLPEDFRRDEIQSLYSGIVQCAREFSTRIAGGDLTRSDRLVISISLNGKCAKTGPIMRSNAKPGEAVMTTGDFGASAAGLWLLLNSLDQLHINRPQNDSDDALHPEAAYAHCLQKHLRPRPRLHEAAELARLTGGAAALMDASDGLADALLQIARLSNVGICVEEALVPIHDQTVSIASLHCQSPLDMALYGGEDYELVATCATALVPSLVKAGFQRIGTVVEGDNVTVLCANGKEQIVAAEKTFHHWRN